MGKSTKKPYSFNELSNITCVFPGCSKRLKKNLVERKEKLERPLCYKHYMHPSEKAKRDIGYGFKNPGYDWK